jgi:hypothetical protein
LYYFHLLSLLVWPDGKKKFFKTFHGFLFKLQEELVEQFKEYFELLETIPTPVFRFGGKTGSVVTSLVFRKRSVSSTPL